VVTCLKKTPFTCFNLDSSICYLHSWQKSKGMRYQISIKNSNTGGPRYMRPLYLRFCICAIEKWSFSWNLSSILQLSLVFLYSNSLYASLFFESLSLSYNEVHLYFKLSNIHIGTCLRLYKIEFFLLVRIWLVCVYQQLSLTSRILSTQKSLDNIACVIINSKICQKCFFVTFKTQWLMYEV